MSGFRKIEQHHCYGYIYDKDYQSPESITEELWDENIDYVLALREIVRCESATAAKSFAEAALSKYNQQDREDDD